MYKLSYGLVGGGVITLLVSVFMGWWGLPQLIRSIIRNSSKLEKGSLAFETWKNPTATIEIFLNVYFFNVTNPLDVLKGAQPQVQEVGPYVFSESRIKYDIAAGEEPDMIKYQQRIFYHFESSMSVGDKEDRVTIVNIPFVGVVKTARSLTDSDPVIMEDLNDQLVEKEETLFRTDSIQNLLFDGFSVQSYIDILSDPLVEAVVGPVKIPHSFSGGKFAIYKGRNGSDEGLFEVNTGRHYYQKYGEIHKWNNRAKLPWWNADSCNKLTGTDGTIFPPFLTRHNVLKSFSPELCRTLSMTYVKDVKYKSVPGFRFSPVPETAQGPHKYKPNQCFCPEKAIESSSLCNRNGVMQLSNCKEGAPVSLSSPHFYDADMSIIEAVRGLEPIMEKHKTFIDIEPNTGVMMRASKRLQFNIDISPCESMPSIKNIRTMVFPIMWAEEKTELPEELMKRLLQLHHTQNKVETARWSMVGVSLVCIALGVVWTISHKGKILGIDTIQPLKQ